MTYKYDAILTYSDSGDPRIEEKVKKKLRHICNKNCDALELDQFLIRRPLEEASNRELICRQPLWKILQAFSFKEKEEKSISTCGSWILGNSYWSKIIIGASILLQKLGKLCRLKDQDFIRSYCLARILDEDLNNQISDSAYETDVSKLLEYNPKIIDYFFLGEKDGSLSVSHISKYVDCLSLLALLSFFENGCPSHSHSGENYEVVLKKWYFISDHPKNDDGLEVITTSSLLGSQIFKIAELNEFILTEEQFLDEKEKLLCSNSFSILLFEHP
ncbi:unnamed protein product [Moneuplotes crassus]|uniref:Uncharacterized protein n=1 Tax=Euplotes crassus TaxID=5936 RepID=A0AAD1UD61_EUPCR|nr:unnamed protein product [Moneuplotes crassus]